MNGKVKKRISDIKPLGFFKKLFVKAYTQTDLHILVDTMLSYKKMSADDKKAFTKSLSDFTDKDILMSLNNTSLGESVTELEKENVTLKEDLAKHVQFRKDNTVAKQDLIDIHNELKVTHKEEVKELNQTIKHLKENHTKQMNNHSTTTADDILKMDKKLNKDSVVIDLRDELEKTKAQLKTFQDEAEKNKSTNGKPKLTCDQVIAIRIEITRGDKIVDIAKRYDVSDDTINRIKQGKTYKQCV